MTVEYTVEISRDDWDGDVTSWDSVDDSDLENAIDASLELGDNFSNASIELQNSYVSNWSESDDD